MSELTQEELRTFSEFCDTLINNPHSYVEIVDSFIAQDPSFEYLFLFQRVKISAEAGPKAVLKTAKEIKAELRATIRINEGEVVVAYNGMNDFLNMRPFGAPPR